MFQKMTAKRAYRYAGYGINLTSYRARGEQQPEAILPLIEEHGLPAIEDEVRLAQVRYQGYGNGWEYSKLQNDVFRIMIDVGMRRLDEYLTSRAVKRSQERFTGDSPIDSLSAALAGLEQLRAQKRKGKGRSGNSQGTALESSRIDSQLCVEASTVARTSKAQEGPEGQGSDNGTQE